jgi:hypothetical protein
MTPNAVIPSSYEQDYLLWTEETVDRLRSKKFDSLDLENLIEEVLDLGRSQKRELKSRLGELLEHLLKRIYVTMPDCYRGWGVRPPYDTFSNQRNSCLAKLSWNLFKNHIVN